MREYSAGLVSKLEKKNLELQQSEEQINNHGSNYERWRASPGRA